MIAAIFNAIAAIPTLISAIEKFSTWLMGQIDLAKKRQLINQMNQSANQSQKTKDTSGIDTLFNGDSK